MSIVHSTNLHASTVAQFFTYWLRCTYHVQYLKNIKVKAQENATQCEWVAGKTV